MFVHNVLAVARERLVMIGINAPVIEAAQAFGIPHTHLIVVCNDVGVLAGVLSKTDIVKHISHCLGGACSMAASTIMTREVVCCHSQDSLLDVWSMMKARMLLCVPVVGPDSRPQGILYARDTLQALLTEVQDEESLLLDYVMSIGYH
jgi:CBS domain-containing protein